MATAYPKLPPPHYVSPTAEATDPELLYSTAAFTQKGVTLAAGQGVLEAGTILGQNSVDKKYYKYAVAGLNGTNVARGVLRRAADTDGGDQLGNLVIQGILKLSMMNAANGGAIDPAALNDLGAVKDDVRGTFKF